MELNSTSSALRHKLKTFPNEKWVKFTKLYLQVIAGCENIFLKNETKISKKNELYKGDFT